jgi:hypothetical protein
MGMSLEEITDASPELANLNILSKTSIAQNTSASPIRGVTLGRINFFQNYNMTFFVLFTSQPRVAGNIFHLSTTETDGNPSPGVWTVANKTSLKVQFTNTQ